MILLLKNEKICKVKYRESGLKQVSFHECTNHVNCIRLRKNDMTLLILMIASINLIRMLDERQTLHPLMKGLEFEYEREFLA